MNMKRRSLPIFAVFGLVAGLLFACADNPNSGHNPVTVGAQCTSTLQCPAGYSCEDYDCDGIKHCAKPRMGGTVNCCTSGSSCAPGLTCCAGGTCKTSCGMNPPNGYGGFGGGYGGQGGYGGWPTSGSGGYGGYGWGGSGGGTDGGTGSGEPKCEANPFDFTCECMEKCKGLADCQVCCVGATPLFAALCAVPTFTDVCNFGAENACKFACEKVFGLDQPARGACESACQTAYEFFCNGPHAGPEGQSGGDLDQSSTSHSSTAPLAIGGVEVSPKILCNFADWALGDFVCKGVSNPFGTGCDIKSCPTDRGGMACENCCGSICNNNPQGRNACYNRCSLHADLTY